jgi:hypothetical protein
MKAKHEKVEVYRIHIGVTGAAAVEDALAGVAHGTHGRVEAGFEAFVFAHAIMASKSARYCQQHN